MPSFDLTIDFEVFCACGAHLCNESETRNSRNRNALQVVVNACQSCIEDEIMILNDRIEELKQP